MILSKTENFAFKIAEPIAKEKGYDIYDVEFVKEGPHWFLRIYIEKDDGVNLDDCEIISRELSAKLDEADIIKDNYFLEVSSPGLERMLRHNSHYDRAIGKKVCIKLKKGKEEVGILTSHTSEKITLDDNINIEKQNILKTNIVFDFAE